MFCATVGPRDLGNLKRSADRFCSLPAGLLAILLTALAMSICKRWNMGSQEFFWSLQMVEPECTLLMMKISMWTA